LRNEINISEKKVKLQMDLASKRLSREIRQVRKERLDEQGIFINVNDKDKFHIQCLIVGPDDTPYQDGFYLFDLFFDKHSYPYKPPRAIFQTRNGNLRFNPNLYSNGKVCVSILGTWSGPQWTTCQNLKSVLLSLQMLLTENPLQNEPGYEKVDKRHEIYRKIIEFENYGTAIQRMMTSPPEKFIAFQPLMFEIMSKKIKNIYERVSVLEKDHPETYKLKCTVYGLEAVIDYPSVLSAFQSIKVMLQVEESENIQVEESENIQVEESENIQVEVKAPPKKKAKKLSYRPPIKAKMFEAGHCYTVTVPETNKIIFWVSYKDSRGYYRWKKAPTNNLSCVTPKLANNIDKMIIEVIHCAVADAVKIDTPPPATGDKNGQIF
jgi:ubiquitin-conjugating enzyme E2 Z